MRAVANESGGALATSEPAEERACRMANAAAAVAAREAAWRQARGDEIGAERARQRLSKRQTRAQPKVAQSSSARGLACQPTPPLKFDE